MLCVRLRNGLSFRKVLIFQILKLVRFTLAATSQVFLQISVLPMKFTFTLAIESPHLCFTFVCFVSRLEFLPAVKLQIHNSSADCFRL